MKNLNTFDQIVKNSFLARNTMLLKNYTGELYFISNQDLDGHILLPRVPDNFLTKNGYEDSETPRICFCEDVGLCLTALSANIKGKKFMVYTPDDIAKYRVYKPSIDAVPDSKITGELWITQPVKLKCVGIVLVLGDDGKPGKKYRYGNHIAELYGWRYKWLQRYQTIAEESIETKPIETLIGAQTPKELYDYMRRNIKYSQYSKLKSPDEVIKTKSGSCHDQVVLELYELRKMGLHPKAAYLQEYNPKNSQVGETHSFVYYSQGKTAYWFENAWSGQQGIHEYRDLESLFDDVFERFRKRSRLPNVIMTALGSHKPGEDLQKFVDIATDCRTIRES